MIETKMPKDIRAYKTKLIGPFTGRQAICVVIAGIVFIIFYACIAQPFHLPQEYIFYVGLPLVIPILAFGWYEPNGMKLEKNTLRGHHPVVYRSGQEKGGQCPVQTG